MRTAIALLVVTAALEALGSALETSAQSPVVQTQITLRFFRDHQPAGLTYIAPMSIMADGVECDLPSSGVEATPDRYSFMWPPALDSIEPCGSDAPKVFNILFYVREGVQGESFTAALAWEGHADLADPQYFGYDLPEPLAGWCTRENWLSLSRRRSR